MAIVCIRIRTNAHTLGRVCALAEGSTSPVIVDYVLPSHPLSHPIPSLSPSNLWGSPYVWSTRKRR